MVFAMSQAAAGQAGMETGFLPAELLILYQHVQETEGNVLTNVCGWMEVYTRNVSCKLRGTMPAGLMQTHRVGCQGLMLWFKWNMPLLIFNLMRRLGREGCL